MDWLLFIGQPIDITIIDSASSFPPLLEYYAELESKRVPSYFWKSVQIIRLPTNRGNYAIWDSDFDYLRQPPFIYTDSDVAPCLHCPHDAIDFLLRVAETQPANVQKIGLSLRIDDIPNHYSPAPDVRKWEAQFWENPIGLMDRVWLYKAGTGTTFALYLDDKPHSFTGIRVGHPYSARHYPWYADSENPSDEDRYFDEHAGAGQTHWRFNRCESQAVIDYCREDKTTEAVETIESENPSLEDANEPAEHPDNNQ